jgi:hypothetical protein
VPASEAIDVQTRRTYLKPNRLLTSLLMNLGLLLLTFGALCPPLAGALAVTVVATATYSKLKVGRFLSAAMEMQLLGRYMEVIEIECVAVNAPMLVQNSLWLLLTLSCWFYTLF